MKILLSWLKELVNTNLPPTQIARLLTMAGLEVDAVDPISLPCSGVVVGKVLTTAKHPEADRLTLATVTDGTNEYQLVCGAPNCRPGMKTAFATIGATVFDDKGKAFKIKKSKIRGVESHGMLCAAEELGLSDVSEGIIEFDDHIKEGSDVAELYSDTVFDISLTPNLGHCFSHLGIARELAAITESQLNSPKTGCVEEGELINTAVSVKVNASKECPRYACRVLKNVTITSSPDWLKQRLAHCGIRSINNVVDVTNYVMLELGHPLHAFDLDTLQGQQIIVRHGQENEKITTLDGLSRSLSSDDLVICDQAKPIALAGVMGGADTEVKDSTQNLLLEAAYFDPIAVRRMGKRHGLITDASKRFERGTDPNALAYALDRAAMLIQMLAGGQICRGIIDEATKTFSSKHLLCRIDRANSILGTNLSASEIENIFHRLNFSTSWKSSGSLDVEIPTYRNDINEEIDLIEEIARIYGYDNIGKKTARTYTSTIPHAPIFVLEREARSRLISEGLQELLTCDLIGPSALNILDEGKRDETAWVKVLNPTSIEQSILRTSLLPGLLQVVKYNWDHQNSNLAGFEVGRIHLKENEQYREQSVVGIILSGKCRPHHWDRKPTEIDFFDLKGIIENLLEELHLPNVSLQPSALPVLHPGRQAALIVDDLTIGSLGEVHPAILRRLDVPQRIFFAEINLHDVLKKRSPQQQMQPLPIYPGSERDWTLTLKTSIPISQVLEAIKSTASPLLEAVNILDIYRSEKLGADIQNITLRFTYRDRKKTIAQETVDTTHNQLVNSVLNLIQKSGVS